MILDDKPFEDISAGDILSLIPGIPEGHRLDYKRDLPAEGAKGIRDFLADVSALANTAGGLLLYGVEEGRDDSDKTGLPTGVCGVDAPKNEEVFIAAWQGRTTDTQLIEPRLIPAPRFRFIDGFPGGKKVLVVFVQKSLLAPHWCRYEEKARKFYIRHECNNMLMDIGEVRHAFVEARQIPERVDDFRRLRASQILANEAPLPLGDGFTVVIHLLPLSSFAADAPSLDTMMLAGRTAMRCLGRNAYANRPNFDGMLFSNSSNEGVARCYSQVYRYGAVEIVQAQSRELEKQQVESTGAAFIRARMLERDVIETVTDWLEVLSELQAQPPVFVCLSLLRVKNMVLVSGDRESLYKGDVEDIPRIDKDMLFIAPVIAEVLAADVGRLLKPAFDVLWQASGRAKSLFYNAEGDRVGD